jgi:thiamine-phosphate pyrophosphorylase
MQSEEKPLKVILVSPEKDYPEEHGLVMEMFRLGLSQYHVRKPKYSTEKLKSYLSKFDPKYIDRIVIHTHHELAAQFKIRGIHLTERHRKNNKLFNWFMLKYLKYRRPDLQISTSFHVIHSLKYYHPRYRYVFLNPIFESISKLGHKSTFNENSLRAALQKTKYKVIALGGVTADRISEVKDYGFAGFGLLGIIWQGDDPIAEYKKVIDKCKELNLPVC